MDDVQELYPAVGRKIRAARERSAPRLSQDKLAKRLEISRRKAILTPRGGYRSSLT